jgi:hypothetical protein
LPDDFPADDLSPLLCFRMCQAVLKLNGTLRLLAYANDMNVLEDDIKKSTQYLIDASKKVGLEVNAYKLSIYCYLVTRIQDK